MLAEPNNGGIEPNNPVDKYVVAITKMKKILGHLPLEDNGKFSKTIFYFLWADPYGK